MLCWKQIGSLMPMPHRMASARPSHILMRCPTRMMIKRRFWKRSGKYYILFRKWGRGAWEDGEEVGGLMDVWGERKQDFNGRLSLFFKSRANADINNFSSTIFSIFVAMARCSAMYTTILSSDQSGLLDLSIRFIMIRRGHTDRQRTLNSLQRKYEFII